MRRTVPLVLFLTAVLIATVLTAARARGRQEGVAASPPATAPSAEGISLPAPTMPPPLAPGPAPDLDLVFTSHVIGWIEPCG